MLRAHSSLVLGGLVVVLGAVAACGSNRSRNGFGEDEINPGPGGGGEGDGTSGGPGFGNGDPSQTITVEPKAATVIIDGATNPATAGTQVFKVTRNGKDLTAGATFTLRDPSLGAFKGETFTSVAALPAGVLGKSSILEVKTSEGTGLGTVTVVQLRKTGEQRDFFFVVPYGDNPSPKNDVLKFSTNIKQADVAFLMDTTGSMGGAINNLKSTLSTSVFPKLQAAIPNVGVAVVDFRDFNEFDGTLPVRVRQTITTTLVDAQNAVNAMIPGGGGDTPEASVAAMQYTLTGAANPPIPARANPAGTFGGVDFRPGSVPVVVNITDATWHDPSGNASIASLINAFTTAKARFVKISTSAAIEGQADSLSDATASNVPTTAFTAPLPAGCSAGQCCTGVNGVGRAPSGPGGTCRLNFLSDAGGGGVGDGIVKAIAAIAVGTSFDVKAGASNDPKNAKGVDATKFIKALRAMDEGNPAAGCPAAPAKDSDGDGIKDTFLAVKAGTPVCFEVIPNKNTTVPPEVDPQFYNAFIDVIGLPGNLPLDKRSVLFLVPPKDPGVN